MVNLDDIHFSSRIPLERHSRYAEFRQMIGQRDFAAYRDVFERGWAETSIMCGEHVRLEELPLYDEEPPNTPLVNLMGINEHSPKRVRLAKEFFREYERIGRTSFLKGTAYATGYGQDLLTIAAIRTEGLSGFRGVLARRAQRKGVRYRVLSYLNTYENMKRFGKLVGRAHAIQESPAPVGPSDLPWAIDYCGYIKLRDGAHRRAIAHALGWGTVPTLVFEFGQVAQENLGAAHPYIRDNFHWFAELVNQIASTNARASQA
jgi:hypothetical protein